MVVVGTVPSMENPFPIGHRVLMALPLEAVKVLKSEPGSYNESSDIQLVRSHISDEQKI